MRLGWNGDRSNCFRGAPFEKGVLKDASIVEYHTYGPGRGIAAVSLPESHRFVFATIGLDRIVNDYPDRAPTRPDLGFISWDSDWYNTVLDGDATREACSLDEAVPYGVIFQIVVEEFRVQSHAPDELVNTLMGGEAVEVGEGKVIYETMVGDVLSLFPEMIVYSHDDFNYSPGDVIDHAALQRGMAQIALMAGIGTRSISVQTRLSLALTLSQVGDLVPFSGFTRAALDMDPRSLFMALYRSLENLYSYSEVSLLIKSFGLGMTWVEAAEHLAEKLKWRPKEEEALRKILLLASPSAPLELLIASLPGEASVDDSTNLPKMAASRLYGVRNAVVHARPGLRGIDTLVNDWDEVAIHLAACLLAADTAVEAGKTLDS